MLLLKSRKWTIDTEMLTIPLTYRPYINFTNFSSNFFLLVQNLTQGVTFSCHVSLASFSLLPFLSQLHTFDEFWPVILYSASQGGFVWGLEPMHLREEYHRSDTEPFKSMWLHMWCMSDFPSFWSSGLFYCCQINKLVVLSVDISFMYFF